LSGPIVSLAYGERYLPAIPVLTIMGLMGWAGSLVQPIRAYVLARGRQAVMVRSMLAAVGINLVLALVLIPRYGAWGAAWSNGLTQISVLVLASWMTSRRLGFHVDWAGLVRIGGAAGLMALVVAALTSAVPAPVALLLGVPLGVATYLVLLRALRAVPAADRARLGAAAGLLPGPLRWVASKMLGFIA
jgi:O-antigen/teichoic acid export membrane protein